GAGSNCAMLPVGDRAMNSGGIAIYASSFDAVRHRFETAPLSLRTARTPDALNDLLADLAIHAVVVEMGPPTIDRASTIQSIKMRFPGTPCIVCAHPSTEEVAVAALRAGADDYVRGPVEWATIEAIAKCLAVPSAPGPRAGAIVGTHAAT